MHAHGCPVAAPALIKAPVAVLGNAARCLACAQQHISGVHCVLLSECSPGTRTVPGIGTQLLPSPPRLDSHALLYVLPGILSEGSPQMTRTL